MAYAITGLRFALSEPRRLIRLNGASNGFADMEVTGHALVTLETAPQVTRTAHEGLGAGWTASSLVRVKQ